jgi:hypothetical protein
MSTRLPALARVEFLPFGPPLWLPLFLLWPLVFAIFLFGFVLSLVVPGPSTGTYRALVAAYRMLCALRGFHAEVRVERSLYALSLH